MDESVTCIDCGSAAFLGPDHEGFIDCMTCGAAWVPGHEADKLNMWEE